MMVALGDFFMFFGSKNDMDGCSAIRRNTTLWLEFWRPEALKIMFSRLQNIEDVWANSYRGAIRHCKVM